MHGILPPQFNVSHRFRLDLISDERHTAAKELLAAVKVPHPKGTLYDHSERCRSLSNPDKVQVIRQLAS
jgi:hypothetical protein